MACYQKIGTRPNLKRNRLSWERAVSALPFVLALHLFFAVSLFADKTGTDLNHRFFIEFKSPDITIKAEQAPLGFLLDQIAQATGIHIAHSGIGNRSATADLLKIPLERGLSILLKGYNVAWTYKANPGGKGFRLLEVLVVPAANTQTEFAFDTKIPTQEIVPEYEGEDLAAAEVNDSFGALNVFEVETMLAREQDPALRAILLLQIGNPLEDEIEKATSVLKAAIQDTDPTVRVAALTSLSVMPQEEVEESIVEALNDPAPEVRSVAFNIAGSMSLISPLELIHRGLADKETLVRTAAIEAIAGTESPDVFSLLTTAAEDPDAVVRTAALEAIGQFKNGRLDGEPGTQ